MSLHLGARPGEIAERVLIAGDPLRAKHIAETMLTDAKCYTSVRGMLGYTGMYRDKRVSVQGTGMGIPSTAIYLHELIHEYGARTIIRVGTCGAIQAHLSLGQIILGSAAYTDSATHLLYCTSMEEPASPNAELLTKARAMATHLSISAIAGEIFSSDMFYHPDAHRWDQWTRHGMLAIEMESSILYDLARANGVQALSILSVSDNLLTQTFASSAERELAGRDVMTLALEIL